MESSPALGATQMAAASPAPGAMQVSGASLVPGAMQMAPASSRSRDPRLLGVSFDLPASWGYRKPMGFCKDLNTLATASGSAAAGAAMEPRPNDSFRSPSKGVAAQQADEGAAGAAAAAAQESPRLQCYQLRDRRAGRDSAEDAREHKKLRNMDGVGGKRSGGFSAQLTNQEIEADFIAITGRKPPRRPRKISKIVQRQIEPLFPGTLLLGVNRERYKVNEKGGF